MDVSIRRCEHPGCGSKPRYGRQGERARFCQEHAQEGMVDVVCRTCQHEGCVTRPYFGMPGEDAQFCSKHALKGMVNLTRNHPK